MLSVLNTEILIVQRTTKWEETKRMREGMGLQPKEMNKGLIESSEIYEDDDTSNFFTNAEQMVI